MMILVFNGGLQGVNLPVYYHDQIIVVIGISGKPDKVKICLLAQNHKSINSRKSEQFNRSQAEKCIICYNHYWTKKP